MPERCFNQHASAGSPFYLAEMYLTHALITSGAPAGCVSAE